MALDIARHGIAHRRDEGGVTLYRFGKNGGQSEPIEVGEELAETYRLATGEVIVGATEPIIERQSPTAASDECMEDAVGWDEQMDEPSALRGVTVPAWLVSRLTPSERLASIERINGLSLQEAEDRPYPRRKRSASERETPERRLTLATSANDTTGRLLDFAAPLGMGCAGLIFGAHGSGLTRTLRAVVAGVSANAPDIVVLVLLLRARGEEITDWRRRFPNADVVVCPTLEGVSPEQTLLAADLVMECARRQTELGNHVLLAVDSLTGLWGAMLEAEKADAQSHADQSHARHRIREWIQKAGNFSGDGPLGGSIGGSLTLIGTVWQQAIDLEAEEEREVHPHLRLMEHILHETNWRVALSDTLAQERLYPAIETTKCFSQAEDRLLPAEEYERLLIARRALIGLSPLERYNALMDALDSTAAFDALLTTLTRECP